MEFVKVALQKFINSPLCSLQELKKREEDARRGKCSSSAGNTMHQCGDLTASSLFAAI